MSFRRVFTALFLSLSLASPAFGALRIASWNTLHLGYHNDKDLSQVAAVINRFDLVGLEEVMDKQAVQDLVKVLDRQTGEQWSSSVSHEVGRSSYKEQGLGAEYGHMRELYTRAPWKQ